MVKLANDLDITKPNVTCLLIYFLTSQEYVIEILDHSALLRYFLPPTLTCFPSFPQSHCLFLYKLFSWLLSFLESQNVELGDHFSCCVHTLCINHV